MTLSSPPISYFLRQCTGQVRLSSDYKKIVGGMTTVKHVYEIAQIKSKDPYYQNIPLDKIFQEIVYLAIKMGIKVVHRLDAKQYGEFLEKRKVETEQELLQLEESRQAKLLRGL